MFTTALDAFNTAGMTDVYTGGAIGPFLPPDPYGPSGLPPRAFVGMLLGGATPIRAAALQLLVLAALLLV